MSKRWMKMILIAPLAILGILLFIAIGGEIVHAAVELAAAAALRLAPDYFLASAWDSGVVPDPLRRIWTPRFPALQFPPSHGRALGAHDPGGAGTIPARHARTLRLWSIHQREQGAMKLPAAPCCSTVPHTFAYRANVWANACVISPMNRYCADNRSALRAMVFDCGPDAFQLCRKTRTSQSARCVEQASSM